MVNYENFKQKEVLLTMSNVVIAIIAAVIAAIVFGVIGYLIKMFDLNPASIVLALILGPIGENGLRRSLLLNNGNPAILFSTPVCWVLIFLCVFSIFSPMLMKKLENKYKE